MRIYLVRHPQPVGVDGLCYGRMEVPCMALARRLASPREPISADDLIEMSFGEWQGTRWVCIGREKIDEWAKDAWGYRPGGGESAEMVATRWEQWVNAVRKVNSDAIIAVTHAGVIRVALASGGQRNGASGLEAQIPFGSVHRLDVG